MKSDFLLIVFYEVIFLGLSFVYAKNALHMFQQSRYELRRYNKWLFNKNIIHFSFVLIYEVIVIALSLIIDNYVGDLIVLAITLLFSVYAIYQESKKQYIKDLVITSRVKRQIFVFTIIICFVIYFILKLDMIYMACIVAVFGPYLLIYPLALITYPVEELIKKYYQNDAKKILQSYSSLITIGITGSFGKTSTKNIVNDIISQNYFTLITPSSYNTPMGITKTIRTMLKPIHEVFVCEMGADKVNDISDLMKFVMPKYGVVTSIGPQHLATFKSMDNIINEKMKEIEMLPKDGVGFINLDNQYIRDYNLMNNCKIVSVGIRSDDADYVAKNINYTKDGSSFDVIINGINYSFTTSLLGQHNITNILIGIAIAIELGVPVDDIVKNVKKINQVEHRLEIKKINGFTFIDDAFNANPVGSKMSLDVLSLMSGNRVIVTPGMIDLGSKQYEINYTFGKYMKDKADYCILVGEKQTKAIKQGLIDVNFDMEKVLVFRNVKEAIDYVYANFTIEDTILLENDLPDAFNV